MRVVLKERFKKYSYLLRLILTIFMALMIPFIIMGYLVIQNTYEDHVSKNSEYYLEATYRFSNYFDEQISMLSNHAINVSLDRKILRENIEKEPWKTIEAVTMTLKDYKIGLPFVDVVGIYFLGSDYVLTSGYKYGLDYFINFYGGNNPETFNYFKDFLTSESKGRVKIFSDFDNRSYEDASLFIGVMVKIEKSIDYDAMLFYIIKYDSIETSFLHGFGNTGNMAAIFNNKNDVIYTNRYLESSILDDQFKCFLSNNKLSTYKTINHQTSYNIYKWYNQTKDITFVTFIPEEELQQSISHFYKTTQNIMITVLVVIIAMIFITVYFSYQPILRLSKRIRNYSNDTYGIYGEIESIADTFDKISIKNEIMLEMVSEQRMYLMDYILSNLLDGKSVSEEKMQYMNIDFIHKAFKVITVLGLSLNNLQKGNLQDEINRKCECNVYITDIPFEKHLVIILNYDDKKETPKIVECVNDSISNYTEKFNIAVGNTVYEINMIRCSYLNSLSVLEANAGTIYFDDLPNTKSSIEKYPYVDVLAFLQNIKNGDKVLAVESLRHIVDYVSENVFSQTTERYICYDILTSYINGLRELHIILDKEKTDNLLGFANLDSFHELMVFSVEEVCDLVYQQKQLNQEVYKKSIKQYVDENYCDTDMSLVKVADRFNASIYTLSRLFKDITKIGFKEYVILKRIEKSKILLTQTDMSIKEVSLAVGFNNPSYFTQIFKSVCGVAPSKFKE